mgnify:CR=1 FL=1
MIVTNLFQSILRGKSGMNIGLPSGLPKVDSIIYGVQRRWMYVWAGDSGSGKSSIVLYSQIYRPIIESLKNPDINVHFLLFSFEMSAEVLFAKLLSLYIYEKYGKILSYGQILSLGDVLSDNDYKYVEASKPWLEKVESICEVIDKPVTAKGLYAICKEWSKKFGTYIEEEVSEGYVKETYLPNDDKQYLITVIDHMRLFSLSSGHNIKQEMDEACDYLIHFRNKCGFTVHAIQQLNRNFKSMERRNSENALLGLEDLSDSGGPTQSAETVIAIYHPFREKRNKCEGYDIKVLKDRARLIQILKNRFGLADRSVGCTFYGEVGLWRELPLPHEIQDYTKYINLS